MAKSRFKHVKHITGTFGKHLHRPGSRLVDRLPKLLAKGQGRKGQRRSPHRAMFIVKVSSSPNPGSSWFHRFILRFTQVTRPHRTTDTTRTPLPWGQPTSSEIFRSPPFRTPPGLSEGHGPPFGFVSASSVFSMECTANLHQPGGNRWCA